MKSLQVLLVAIILVGCGAKSGLPPLDPGLGHLALTSVGPPLILPGSQLVLVGQGFIDPSLGKARLRLQGTFTATTSRDLDVVVAARYVDATHLTAQVDSGLLGFLGASDGMLRGDAQILYDSAIDGQIHGSATIPFSLQLVSSLTPVVTSVAGSTLHLNDAVLVSGSGFLLGGGEGSTRALLTGCFLADGNGGPCSTKGSPITVEIEAPPVTAGDRTQVGVLLAPDIFGIHPGVFSGSLKIFNQLASGQPVDGGTRTLVTTLQLPEVVKLAPSAASLGQIVIATGAGFIGGVSDEVTLLRLQGTFAPDGAPSAAVDLTLVSGFVDGTHARYVLDEVDALGRGVDLRHVTGKFTGTVTPVLRKGAVQVSGPATAVTLQIAPVRQVVALHYLPSFDESLRRFGVLTAGAAVRQRILTVAARDYDGVNIDFRADTPTDFAVYAQVDVVGPDPNGLGLLGYDNTPGKDVGNQRLFDRIGGVNATTQEDGFSGYGGIFADQFLGFSAHPPTQIAALGQQSTTFDVIFDPIRPDTGLPITALEATQLTAAAVDGAVCPAETGDRPGQVRCAVRVLGNLLGSTVTHEVGHSLGLADPTGMLFHNPGDEPNRLMDAGDARPFEERAELGEGPGVFCTDDYDYLRGILPKISAPPSVTRPGCD